MPLLLLLNQQPLAIPEGSRAIVLTNAGTGPVTIGTVSLSDDTDGAFTIVLDAASSRTLAPGESATIAVAFDPASEGTKEGELRVPNSDPDGVLFVGLRGVRLADPTPGIAVDPLTWDAGSVLTSSGSKSRTFHVTSTGTGDLTVGTASLTQSGSHFAIGADTASGQVIPPGGTGTVTVTFDPTTDGAKSATLTIPSDAGPDVVVTLAGTGVADPPPPEPDTISVNRFYLGRQATPIALPGDFTIGWWRATEDVPYAMTTVKGGPPTADAPRVDASKGERSLHATWVGPEMAAQAVDTTFTCTLPEAWRSKYLGSYVTSALRFLVWRAATGTLSFLPVLSHATAVDTWKEPADALPRRFPGGVPQSWPASFTLEEGDRLVVQVGCYVTGGTGQSASTRVRFGGSSAQADSGTIISPEPDGASWIAFTDPLLVLA